MAKNSIRDYSATNSSNTDIQSIDISEGCSPAGINNAIREVMADLKDVSTGAVALESPAMDSLTVTGDLTVDTNTLYVDSTSNNVGIGTVSPNVDLQISAPSATLAIDDTTTSVPMLRYRDNGTTIGRIYMTGGDMRFDTNGTTEAMRIDSSGNVGIGTTSPLSDLSVESSTGGVLTLSTSDASGSSGDNLGKIDFYSGDTSTGSTGVQARISGVYDTNGDSTALTFTTGTSTGSGSPTIAERMRITSGGQLLLNTTSAHDGNASLNVLADSGAECISCKVSTNSNYAMNFRNSTGGTVGYIQVGASSTAYITSSDYRLKENVTATWDATTRLKQLNPVRFNFIADADTTVDGFLAHEVQDIVPEAISGTKDAMRDEEYEVTPAVEATYDDDGNVLTEAVPAVMGTRSVPDYQGIDQSKLVPLLVKTIQELEARITALEAN
jgi:hypothetical protein